jgi:7,8-dihydroneopterin aldolase/epimerase/oxygenase
MNVSHRSCIRLVNAVFQAYHGLNPEEHKLGGRYEVDAELSFDFREAAESDDIKRSVDYQQAYGIVAGLMTGRICMLIETLAHEIATSLLHEFPVLESVTVRVRKLNPPLGGLCDHAEADCTISRT